MPQFCWGTRKTQFCCDARIGQFCWDALYFHQQCGSEFILLPSSLFSIALISKFIGNFFSSLPANFLRPTAFVTVLPFLRGDGTDDPRSIAKTLQIVALGGGRVFSSSFPSRFVVPFYDAQPFPPSAECNLGGSTLFLLLLVHKCA